jgi:hypothetical protein
MLQAQLLYLMVGAVASATDGMEDVAVLEPGAAAGAAGAPVAMTLPRALGALKRMPVIA